MGSKRRGNTFTRFLEDGRVCTTNTAAGRTLIEACKLNGVDPRAWLTDVLARLPPR